MLTLEKSTSMSMAMAAVDWSVMFLRFLIFTVIAACFLLTGVELKQ